ncbi:MAG: DsbA family protein [Bacteroidota bacterium]
MNPYCDPQTGICSPSSLQELENIGSSQLAEKTEIIYVGDPMCSWCWGISPALMKLRNHYRGEEVSYRIVVGGLRPGGGDPWNDEMKDFLKTHWGHVEERSGQPFGYALMDQANFDYDTEPSCRAVVAARPLITDREMEFFEEIQRKFYVQSEDPKETSFYESICSDLSVDFDDFKHRFESDEVKSETLTEFKLNRKWGVQGYPAVILLHKDQLFSVAQGFETFDGMSARIEQLLAD